MWPFLGLFMLWAWFKVPAMRWMLVAGVAGIAFMWFGVPTITNGRPDIAGQLAQASPRALHSNRFFGTIGRYHELQYLPVWIAAALTVVWAFVRRRWVVVALAVGAAGWVLVEIAFAYHGWPALPRYMFEAAAVAGVVAGVGVGWALAELAGLTLGGARWAGVAVTSILVIALIPGAISRMRAEQKDLGHERARTHEISLLQSVTNDLGGFHHVLDCGQPVTDIAYVSSLAWLYRLDVGSVGGLEQRFEAGQLANRAIAKVLFKPLSQGGWNVEPWHTRRSQIARCAGLHVTYTSSGALIRP